MLRSLASLTALLFVGCSSSPASTPAPDASTDTGTDVAVDTRPESRPGNDDVAPPDDTGSDSGCNAVANVALEVTENDLNKDLPLGSGGLIADGVYVLTEITKYTGPTGRTGPGPIRRTETIRVANVPTGVDVQGVRKDGDAAGFAYTAEAAPSGGSMKWKVNCPEVGTGVTYDYDADPDKIILYDKAAHVGYHYSFKFRVTSP